ncbi:MAG: 30S ribosomal protein S20 [Candidatus Dojkabacteria bacterium]|nr:30S ribosomal protein S20 [Candidatus Dojkabacteria bacterium]
MANTKSAQKAIRSSARKTLINLKIRRAYKAARKAVLDAVSNKDKKSAETLIPKAYKEIDKAAKKNVLHKNTAARYKSNLSSIIKSI